MQLAWRRARLYTVSQNKLSQNYVGENFVICEAISVSLLVMISNNLHVSPTNYHAEYFFTLPCLTRRLCVRWGPTPTPHKGGGAPSPIFGPFLLWPNGWMHQDPPWYGGRPQTRGLWVRWGPTAPPSQQGGRGRGQNPGMNGNPVAVASFPKYCSQSN